MKTILTHLILLTFLSLALSSCAKKPTDFAALTTSAVTSDGSGDPTKITEVLLPLCSQATNKYSCQDLGDSCQGEFNEESEGTNEMTFIKCIPKIVVDDVADVSNPPPLEIPNVTVESNDPKIEAPPVASPNVPQANTVETNEPKIEEPTVASPFVPIPRTGCLDPVSKKFLIDEGHKVQICHRHGNGDEDTIRPDCHALKAHLNHKQSDYLGACVTLRTNN